MAEESAAAAVILRAWLKQEPDNAYVRHHLAACEGSAMPERASDDYVEHEFDAFAATFDSTLARLNYRAPQIVAAAVARVLPPAAQQFDIVDLGCGTGLCGPLLEPWARTLVGCDLSTGMLMRAGDRGVYHELRKAELTAFMRGRPAAYDWPSRQTRSTTSANCPRWRRPLAPRCGPTACSCSRWRRCRPATPASCA